jgi:hypothetical protein
MQKLSVVQLQFDLVEVWLVQHNLFNWRHEDDQY